MSLSALTARDPLRLYAGSLFYLSFSESQSPSLSLSPPPPFVVLI